MHLLMRGVRSQEVKNVEFTLRNCRDCSLVSAYGRCPLAEFQQYEYKFRYVYEYDF